MKMIRLELFRHDLPPEKRKRGICMAMENYKLTDINLTEEELIELEEAEKKEIIFEDDCPRMTADMLRQFHPMNRSILVNLDDVE